MCLSLIASIELQAHEDACLLYVAHSFCSMDRKVSAAVVLLRSRLTLEASRSACRLRMAFTPGTAVEKYSEALLTVILSDKGLSRIASSDVE